MQLSAVSKWKLSSPLHKANRHLLQRQIRNRPMNAVSKHMDTKLSYVLLLNFISCQAQKACLLHWTQSAGAVLTCRVLPFWFGMQVGHHFLG